MKKALIGYTGFVGSNLQTQIKFDDFYNSKNIQDIKNKEYDVVYCAGAPAANWIANQKPTEDLQIFLFLLL
jgi:putative intracellular protease/amidase